MDAREMERFRRLLLRQRHALLREVLNVEVSLQGIAEDRESELEEAAQEERTAQLLRRLDDRGKGELQEIERALFRIGNGRYGVCEGCQKPIRRGRLAAIPATPYCRECAGRVERGEPLEAEPPAPAERLPADYTLLTDRELEEAVREQLRDDGRVDLDELRIVCRHGVVYVDGALPSEGEHQIVRQTITDLMGLSAVLDRVQVKEILWEREDRDKIEPVQERPPWEESIGTEDVVEAHEDGVDFVPPLRPQPEEE